MPRFHLLGESDLGAEKEEALPAKESSATHRLQVDESCRLPEATLRPLRFKSVWPDEHTVRSR